MVDEAAVPVDEFAGEKSALRHPLQKIPVTLPQRQVEQAVVFDPLKVALRGIDQRSLEVRGGEDKNVPVLVVAEGWKRQKSSQGHILHPQAALLADFPHRALLRRLARLQFAPETVPLSLMHVVRLLDAVDHERPSVPLDVTERGELHTAGQAALMAPTRD